MSVERIGEHELYFGLIVGGNPCTIAIDGFSGAITADIQRGPIDGKNVSGTLRLEAGIGSITITGAAELTPSPAGTMQLI